MRIRFPGHVERMSKRTTYLKIEDKERLGRSRKSWLDDFQDDLRMLGVVD
jgi:hypothetical protein